ncbi:MAG: ribokinase [Paracoccaceae bacterium]|nr:MAG: ribokinase [Paracoccaceae bacterium]
MRLIQLSGAVCDLVYRVPGLPAQGAEVVATAFAARAGGGFNALAAARRQGMAAAYGGGIGTGPFAGIVAAALEAEGARPLIPPLPVDQGNCVVLVEPSGERSFVSVPGAETQLTAEALAGLPAAPWAMLSGYSLAGAGAGALASHAAALPAGTRLFFDPAPIVATIPAPLLRAVLARADWISANRAEAAALVGIDDPAAAVEALRALCPRAQGAVLRDGPRGCWLATGTGALHLPGLPVRAIDTTGAGDCHAGAFLAALDRGEDPASAARLANAAAAISTMHEGPATAPTLAETRAFLARGPARH